jgi:hypothetical protein
MTDSARTAFATLRSGFLNFGENRFPLLAREIVQRPFAGEVVNLAKDIRESTAKEIADWLAADAPTHDDGMYGGIATETLRQAAKKIREKYGVTP